jgi:hypothetical protein
LKEGDMFVSFTKNLIVHLLGSEEDIISFLGYKTNKKGLKRDDED